MKLSARNVLEGKVVKVVRGKTTGHVKIDVEQAPPAVTPEAIDALSQFAPGRLERESGTGRRAD